MMTRGGGPMIPSVHLGSSYGDSMYVTSPGASSSTSGSTSMSTNTRRGPSLRAKSMFTANPAVYAPVNRQSVGSKGSYQLKFNQQQQQLRLQDVPAVSVTQPSPASPQNVESSKTVPTTSYPPEKESKGVHSVEQPLPPPDGRPAGSSSAEHLESPLDPLSATSGANPQQPPIVVRDKDGLESGWF
jgi:hypothetical protein